MNSISVYLSHDASICINPNDGEYRIYELERYSQQRYFRVNDQENFEKVISDVYEIIKKEYNNIKFDKCYIGNTGQVISSRECQVMTKVFGINNFIEVGHHKSHAACALYQSDFDDCIIFSYDGGGFDDDKKMTTFNVFVANKKEHKIEKITSITIDIGNAYSLIAVPIKEIRKGNFLSYAGKIMGLAAYGEIRNEWVESFKSFYRTQFFQGSDQLGQLSKLGNSIGLNLSSPDTIEGKVSYDLAATSQFIFEEIALELMMPFIKKYNLPICLTGGCGLNVLFNERLKKETSLPVFVPPNPNDCGLSIGQILLHEPPLKKVNITYSGFGLIDIEKLPDYIEKYDAKKISIPEIAQIISEGKIVGIARGMSECGPRALGNRSIICDPSVENMKDVLNAKVKFREWYRPFAPIVKLEDANKYFDFEGEAPFMSFAPRTRPEWEKALLSITHEDKTSRIQTLTKEQNNYIYDLITEFEKISGHGVILNTSFNIKGKPILTTISDAIEVLEDTEIDYVIIEDYLFKKLNIL